jgi:hypothetical protein
MNDYNYYDGSAGITVKLDLSKYSQRLAKAQEALDMMVLRDTEPYVRYDTGRLNENSLADNKQGSGQIVYSAYDKGRQYAKYPYYNTENNVSTHGHPQARPLWFEYSKGLNREKWISEVKKIIGGE